MIGWRERWCYAAGDAGFNVVWQSTELYLLFFYIRGLHLPPAFASSIFLAGAAVDWIADPLVGLAADRAAPRVPLRRWVVVGGPLAVLALVAVFGRPPVPRPLVPGAALAGYMVLRAAYSLGNVPYAALTARISPHRAGHLALTGARLQGAALGGLVAGIVYLLSHGHGEVDYRHGALVLAALSLPAFLLTGLGVTERVAPARAGPAASAGLSLLALVRRSSALRRLLAVVLTAGLTVTVIDKSLLFLFEALGLSRTGYLVALAPSASLLLTGGGWSRLGARIGMGQVLAGTAAVALAATLAALAVPVAAAVVPLTCVAIVAGCGMSVMFWALVPGAVAACEALADGQGCAGRVYALANMARKLAGATGPVFVTFALGPGGARALLATIAGCAALALATALRCRPAFAGAVAGGSGGAISIGDAA